MFSIPLFEDEYPGDLQPIIDGCKLLSKRPGVTKSNNHGYQSTDDLHTHPFMDPLIKWICMESGDAFDAIGCAREQVFVEGCWFNLNNTMNAHNQIHLHSGLLSGVFYLEAPEGSGNINFINTGFNQLWQGHHESLYRNDTNAFHFTVKPKPGMLYLWPSYLYHSVDSNHSDVERLSISFNLR